MRYQCPVTDFVHQYSLTHLSAAEARLSAVLARPKLIAMSCVVSLTALGWLALGLMMAGSASEAFSWLAICQPIPASGLSDLALITPMWMAMTLAMMLPTAGPMILTYAEIADTAVRKREPVVSPLILTAGYVLVWLGFAPITASLQWSLAHAGLLDGGSVSRLLGGAIFVVAGLYQFSTLKQACLTLCQRPFPFFFSNWTTERGGVLRLGLRQGLYCLGCCWAMMLLMFSVGVMNVIWMAALGVLMTVEKMTTNVWFSKIVGMAFVALGLAMIAMSVG